MFAVACLLSVALSIGQTPIRAEHALAAWRDLSYAVPPELREQTRYLILRSPEEESAVLFGHVHHLNRTPNRVRPIIVEDILLRVYASDYGWDREVYERLAEVDPYCNFTVDVAGKRVRVPNPLFLRSEHGAKPIEYLTHYTKSKVPLLVGEWFFFQTAIQQGRKAGYYDFLGVKTLTDFYRVVGFDAKLAKGNGQILREAVALSKVGTIEERGFVRKATVNGSIHLSLDFTDIVGKKNPLRVLGQEIEDALDGTEVFAHLPCGFWATAAADAKGKLLDVAPGNIANDGEAPGNDKQVHVNLGCMRCHLDDGMKSFKEFFRRRFAGDLKDKRPTLGTFDHAKSLELSREYLRSWDDAIREDRERFGRAVKEVTGLEGREYLQRYAEYWTRYRDARVDSAYAAKSVGASSTKDFLDALRANLPTYGRVLQVDPRYGALDTVLAALVDGEKIGIRSWEEVYPLAVTIYWGLKK